MFEVDRKGLSNLLARKSKAFIIYELWSNAVDAPGTTQVDITLTPLVGVPKATLVIDDDSSKGFEDLSHAYTLFAPSKKVGNPEQRGRFNLGEKLVLAICDEAAIITTTGALRFDKDGRHTLRNVMLRERGTRLEATFRLTRDELAEVESSTKSLIVPANIITTFNGVPLTPRSILKSFKAKLQTEIGEDGALRRSIRETAINVYEPLCGEVGTLYEMGVPVVETGDKYHVDIQQKIPLTIDRENVLPSYLQAVRALTLNATHEFLTTDDANAKWVKEGMSDERVEPEAVKYVVERRFGPNAVAFDPSDPESAQVAISQGRTVVTGSQMSKEEWAQVRQVGALPSAGIIYPVRSIQEQCDHVQEVRTIHVCRKCGKSM